MKMRVAFWMQEGTTLAWARRLQDEGCKVLVHHADSLKRHIGEGIVPIASSLTQWYAFGNAGRDTIWFFDCTGSGKTADRLRRMGKLVVGGGEFMDRLECDREFGQAFAQQHGILCPPTRAFSSVKASLSYIQSAKQTIGDGGWAWKPNEESGGPFTFVGDTEKVLAFAARVVVPQRGDAFPCIVQERIPGVALSTARWWNGTQWTGPYEGTIEEKKFMDGDVGVATGCALNTVWFYLDETPKIAQALRWEALAGSFRAAQAPPGLYDINAIVNRDGAYFLEWTPRLGIDSELTSQRGVTNLSELLYNVATGGEIDHLFRVDRGYHAVRLSVVPYPCEDENVKNITAAIGVPIAGVKSLWRGDFVAVGVKYGKQGLEVADPYGFVGSAVSESRSVNRGFDLIAQSIKTFDIPGLQYRTDGAKIVSDDLTQMRKLGWETTPYLNVMEKGAAA